MKIIFLDFDGVLNSNQSRQKTGHKGFGAEQLDPAAVTRLEKLVQSTGAKIVVSSSWRHIFSLSQIRGFLARTGAPRAAAAVIDRTPTGMGNRGGEIQDWLDLESERITVNPEHDRVMSYVIIDDDNDMTPQQQPRMIHTNPQYGLTDQDVVNAISILRMGG